MATSLNRSPVLSTGQANAADGVHHTLVVSCSSKWVCYGKVMRFENALDDCFAVGLGSIIGQFLWREGCFNSSQAVDCKVGKDLQMNPAVGQFLNAWRNQFSHRVHGICSHCVSAIDHNVKDDHRATEAMDRSCFNALASAPKANHG